MNTHLFTKFEVDSTIPSKVIEETNRPTDRIFFAQIRFSLRLGHFKPFCLIQIFENIWIVTLDQLLYKVEVPNRGFNLINNNGIHEPPRRHENNSFEGKSCNKIVIYLTSAESNTFSPAKAVAQTTRSGVRTSRRGRKRHFTQELCTIFFLRVFLMTSSRTLSQFFTHGVREV